MRERERAISKIVWIALFDLFILIPSFFYFAKQQVVH